MPGIGPLTFTGLVENPGGIGCPFVLTTPVPTVLARFALLSADPQAVRKI
jgi:hypothetical protein